MEVNIKDFILKDKDKEEEPKKKTEAKKIKKSVVNYEVILVSGGDCIISRKTEKTEKQLVLLVSQNQFYIKEVKKGEIKRLTDRESIKDNIADFFSKLENPLVIEKDGERLNYTTTFYKGAGFAESLSLIFSNLKATERIKKGYLWIEEFDLTNRSKRLFVEKTAEQIKKELTFIPKEYHKEYIKIASYEIVYRWTGHSYNAGVPEPIAFKLRSLEKFLANLDNNILYQKHGTGGLRDFVNAFIESGYNMEVKGYGNNGYPLPIDERILNLLFVNEEWLESFLKNNSYHYYGNGIAPREFANLNLNLKKAINYIFEEGIVQGYGNNINDFLQIWCDTLRMEYYIYGDFVDKYPEHLASFHQILTYKYAQIKQKIDEKKFADHVKRIKVNNWKPEDCEFMITCPETANDMLEEARMQANCLASYVNSFMNGCTNIYFLRKQSEPDKSFVTIELSNTNTIVQAKARFNNEPTPEAKAFIDQWIKKVVLKPKK